MRSKLVGALIVVSLFAVGASVFAGPTAAGNGVRTADRSAAYTFDRLHKVLIYGLAPNQVVTVYGVDGTDTPTFDNQGVPSGQFAGVYVQAPDRKPMEIYVPWSNVALGPNARQSRLFSWSAEGGWALIGAVTPLEAWPDTVINVSTLAR